MPEQSHSLSKHHPFKAALKERYRLSLEGSPKEVYHLTLDIRGSDITYEAGDSLAVIPSNGKADVQAIVDAMKATGDEKVNDPKKGDIVSFRHFLLNRANISSVTRKLAKLLANKTHNPQLETLATDREALKQYHVWDFLEAFGKETLSPQELTDHLLHLLPRLYSIASAPHSDEVHLTVARQRYEAGGLPRSGVATQFLCHDVPLNEPCIPIYVQSGHHFRLPSNPKAPIIMIGAGTGIAPFRAFMQQRALGEPGQKNWLFLGQCTSDHDFYYRDFWQDMVQRGILRLETAFSRDQEHKIYVQHRLEEQGEELMRWLEGGAILYVCGDAKRMAKDVDAALQRVICQHGNKDEEQAKAYLRSLRAEKRYLRDIY